MLHLIDATLYVGLPYALVTLSFVITFQYLKFPDITCASTFVLGGAIAASAIVYGGLAPPVAIIFAVVAGVLGGLFTAALHLILKIDKLLSGILCAFAIYSFNLLILHPTIPYRFHPTVLTYWENVDVVITGTSSVPWHTASAVFLFGVVIIAKLALDFFFTSELGLCLRALEDEHAGPVVLDRIGVAPWKVKALGLATGNALVALAGALVSMAEGAANAHRGFDVLITGLIAYLIGSKCRDWIRIPHRKRTAGVPATYWRPACTSVAIVGPLVYFGVINLAHRANIAPEYAKILIAIYVALTIGDKKLLLNLYRRAENRNGHVASHGAVAHPSGLAPLAVVEHLSFTYRDHRVVSALRDVGLILERGSLVLLTGSNGSGKSTLLRYLAGRAGDPDGGYVVMNGQEVTHDRDARRHNCGYVDQHAEREVATTLTVEENLAIANISSRPSLWRRALDTKRRDHIQRIINDSNISAGLLVALPGQLSGGQRQIVGILTLFARNVLPPIALLDEPMNNLDHEHMLKCVHLVKRLLATGTTVVIVSHSHRDQFCPDVVLHMNEGGLHHAGES